MLYLVLSILRFGVPAHSDTGYIITEKDRIYGFAGGYHFPHIRQAEF